MSTLEEASAFVAIVHNKQRGEGLWLAQNPFVQAVRTGSARWDEIHRWVRGMYATSCTYNEFLEFGVHAVPAEVLSRAQQDLNLLLRFAHAVGLTPVALPTSQQGRAFKDLEAWMRDRMAVTNDLASGHICWQLVAAMNPEAGDQLAEGLAAHFGCDDEQIRYFTAGMKSDTSADEDAVKMLNTIASAEWEMVLMDTLLLSRLVIRLYDSAADMWSSW